MHGADALDGYSQFDLVCLDDLQRLPQDHESELALFSLINTLRQHHGRLVISADRAVSELTIRLPDLKTRLSWGAVYRLDSVADEQLSQALAMRAQIVGLSLSDEVLNYLANRQSRDLSSLVNMLQKLSDASMREQRKITIPFVRSVLDPA